MAAQRRAVRQALAHLRINNNIILFNKFSRWLHNGEQSGRHSRIYGVAYNSSAPGSKTRRDIEKTNDPEAYLTTKLGLITAKLGLITAKLGLITAKLGLITTKLGLITAKLGLITQRDGCADGGDGKPGPCPLSKTVDNRSHKCANNRRMNRR